jgi:CubicO group peptidase (beta-lactamase class C family)
VAAQLDKVPAYQQPFELVVAARCSDARQGLSHDEARVRLQQHGRHEHGGHVDPQEAGLPYGNGTFYWDGAAGTWFWIDPVNDLALVGMIQMQGRNRPDGLNSRVDSASTAVRRAGVYGKDIARAVTITRSL